MRHFGVLALVTGSLLITTVGQVSTVQLRQPTDRAQIAATEFRANLDQYCVTCHSERLRRGEVVLESLDLSQIDKHAEQLEKVVRKLRARQMPPSGARRPDEQTYEGMIAWVEGALDRAVMDRPNPGRPMVHRLNRAEYVNAVRDLLGIEMDGASLLPADTSGYGFDNVADVLSVSPALMERYMSAARRISRLVVGDSTLPPSVDTYKLSRLYLQEDRRDDLPFGTRGGVAIRHYFPLDGEYEIAIDFNRGYYGHILGRHESNQIEVRVDGERIELVTKEAARIPPMSPVEIGNVVLPNDGPVRVRVPIKGGDRTVGVAIVKQSSSMVEGVGPSRLPLGASPFPQSHSTSPLFGKIELGIGSIEIKGPFQGTTPSDSPSRRDIFVCRPVSTVEEKPCARRIIARLARRAYRQEVAARDLDDLLASFDRGRSQASFDRGIQLAIERILVSPSFLFRAERTPANIESGEIHRITNFELASRLSFFLWSSIPDAELLDLASQAKLFDRKVLEAQVKRMLRDQRSKAFRTNFFGQWLLLRNLRTHLPDGQAYPEFDEELRDAFERETDLFLESQIREDSRALDLLTANYTFVNERLARHYGIPGVFGSHFRRVTLPVDGPRAGLLGQGSVLMVTSYPNRTSPVLRGKWLLQNVIGTPPPDPPPDVPSLREDEAGKVTSVRARLEQHRSNVVCATCHSQIDPPGFALENFDAVGAWRDAEGDTQVDAAGAFPTGAAFDGPVAFRRVLTDPAQPYPYLFMTTLAERLLTYALGRGVEPYDMPSVRAIVRQAALSNYQWSALITGTVESTPFQMRKAE